MAKAVETFANISANDLLNASPRLFGWVRKGDNSTGLLSAMKKLDGWPWYYMILKTGCLYLFKKSDSSNFTEAIPLTTHKVCDAPDVTKYRWVFKLIHSTEVKTLFFAVDTDFDLKKWKDAIISEKDEYTDAAGYNYCKIDEPSVDTPFFGKPLPSAPPLPRKLPERPPAPLPAQPLTQRRPYSLSLPPEPMAQYNQPKIAPPPQNKRSPRSPINPTEKKAATLPRPLPATPGKPNLPAQNILHRTSSESRLGAKSAPGFDSVVKQLGSLKLTHIRERDSAPPLPQPPPKHGVLRLNTRESSRRPPDGCENSIEKYSEVSEAYQKDMTSESASKALQSEPLGTYLTRPGNSKSGKSLSFRDKNEDGTSLIRHYRIFYTEGLGYALETKGPRFRGISQMVEHYYQHKLPNTENKLRHPYTIKLLV